MWYSRIDLLPHNHIHHLVHGNLRKNSIKDVEVWKRYLQHLSIILSITVSFIYLHVCCLRWQGTEKGSTLLYISSPNRAPSSTAATWWAPDQNELTENSNFCFMHIIQLKANYLLYSKKKIRDLSNKVVCYQFT